MTQYSVQPKDQILVKAMDFFFFCQKLPGHIEQFATDVLKTASEKAIQKATGDLISNKIADKITQVSKTSPPNNSQLVINEIERYISPEERQKIIDDLRLI